MQAANQPREGQLGFVTVLVYPAQGFLIHYGSQGTVNGEYVTGCIPNDGGSLRLLALDPALDLDYAAAMAVGMSTTSLAYDLDLETATGLSLEAFYDDFRAERTPVCLRTPRSLWPNP